MKNKKHKMLFWGLLIIVVSCSDIDEESTSETDTNPKTMMVLRDSCFEQVNKELTGLLNQPAVLKKRFHLSDDEVRLITNPQSKGEITQSNGRLIEKLIPLITDTTDLKISCGFYDIEKARLGDLALLCIYRLEEFPFASALMAQWCTGGVISEGIQLPYNLTEYTNFNREKIKKSYSAYYYGEERILYLKENSKK